MNENNQEGNGWGSMEPCDETMGWTPGPAAHLSRMILVLFTSLASSVLIGGNKQPL